MSAAPTVRRIDPSEWKQYRDIRLRALKDSPDAFGSTYEASRLYAEETWIGRLEKARPATDHPMFAMMDGEIVGLAWARIEPAETDAAHLYQMWVDPRARGNGAGRALVEAAVAWARDGSVARMVLEVTCGDRPARRLYDAVGFEPVGAAKPLRPGSDLLEQTMELDLSDAAV